MLEVLVESGCAGAFEALAVWEHGIADYAQGCVYEIV